MQQLKFNFLKNRDATLKEINEWQEKELQWWGDRQLKIVALAAVIQLATLGFMALMMIIIGHII